MKERFGITEVVSENYPLNAFKGDLNITSILTCLDKNPLSVSRAQSLKAELMKLPPIIKIFLNSKRISCDVVVVKDGKPHFIKYHEHQHYDLGNNRVASVYTLDGKLIPVPRNVQRFLRDVWRLRSLQPFYIVSDEKFRRDGLPSFDLNCDTHFEYCPDNREFFGRFAE